MNKKIRNIVSLKIPAGEASSKPPLGSTIGQFGVPIMDFCNLFNKISLEKNYKKGVLINCKMYIYYDFSFDLELKNVDFSYIAKIVLKDKLLIGKKNLSTGRGRVQAVLYGVKKRVNRKKKKKFTLFFLNTQSLFNICEKKYNFLDKKTPFVSYYKSLFGSCKSMGIFIFPSYFFGNYKKLYNSYFYYLLNNELKESRNKLLRLTSSNYWFFK